MNWIDLSENMLLFFAVYFTCINSFYAILCLISFFSIRAFSPSRIDNYLPPVFSEFVPPVTLIVPAYNEELTISSTLRSLLQLEYSTLEIICVNDGSKDGTLDVLKKHFELEVIVQAPRCDLPCSNIRAIYLSKKYPNLRIIDKENGGKADSLNAGTRYSNYEYLCCIDADSILQRDSLLGLIRPFLDDPTTVAVGGTVRLANGCEVRDGHIVQRGLPKSFLTKLQTLEYLRAFLFGSIGWAKMNALLVISGAFGLFKRQALIDVGGYRVGTIGEDMELILRMHRYYRTKRLPYRIHFVADPVCWTEAPEDLKTLKNQRVRWHRGLAEALSKNKLLFFNPKAGFIGLFAFPFFIFFELCGPIIELIGLLFMIAAIAGGWMREDYVYALCLMSMCSGLYLSTVGILLEEIFFHVQVRVRDFWWLFFCAVFENFGYRQLNTVFQFIGVAKWMTSAEGEWGMMTRKGYQAGRK